LRSRRERGLGFARGRAINQERCRRLRCLARPAVAVPSPSAGSPPSGPAAPGL